jgi:Ca2+-binding EF-hand superfamily protein
MSSGRPSAVIDDAQCQTLWTMASLNGAALSQDQAVPYIVNFRMVDVDNDGTISADEFKAACGKVGTEPAQALSWLHAVHSNRPPQEELPPERPVEH